MTTHQTRTSPFRRVPPAAHQPGPVTVAIRAIRGTDPEREALHALRASIAARIAADQALLARLDLGDAA